MKNLLLTLFFLLINFALIAQSTSQLTNKIDQYLLEMQHNEGLNGVVLVAEKGKILYKKAFGLANTKTKRALTTNAPFYLGSIAKQFTSMGIMMLKEQGKLTYEDPLSKYFPQFPTYSKNITIRHLMTHTSGIKDHYNLGIYKKGLTNQEVFNELVSNTLNFEPGEKYQYSNGAYVLLAMIIEKVSNQSLHKFMDQQIFKPLSMKCSYVVHPKTKHKKHRAIGFSIKDAVNDKAMGNDYEIFTTGAGGIYSNASDLLKWDQALYTEKLVSKLTMKEAYQSAKLMDGTLTNYGFGWAILEKDNIVGHSGSLNGFRNFMDRDLDHQITLIGLTNNTATYRDTLRKGLRNLVFNHFKIHPPKTIAEKLAQAQLDAYNGHNLEAFLAPYAEDVKVYRFPNQLRYEGKEAMRKTYQFIEQNPELHCELMNRIVEGNTVIDHENVIIGKGRPPFKAIAIYKIKGGKISEVYFIR